jgi:drug/metabolite transporter (DMT)-like permease
MIGIRSQNGRGLASILFSSFLFGIMVLFVKIVSGAIPAAQILFVRAVFGIVVILLVMLFKFRRIQIKNMNMLVVRGVFGGLAVFLYFTAISRIPLSSAAMLSNAYPLFATLFSAILIKEKPNFDSILALLVAFLGMYLILDPHFGKIDIGYLLAIAAAVFGGVAVMAVRELRKTDSSWIIVFAQMAGAFVFCVPFLPIGFRVPNLTDIILLLLIAIIGLLAQLAFTNPFKYIHVAEGSIVALAQAAFAVLFAILFLGEALSLLFIFGALLVFGSTIYLIVREEASPHPR